ncbi:hypothetical protein OHU34_36550 [Streptomyces sp. NBC_00080]|uniref:hypothetical protein n=1 Tax=Streptomyces TaxID=1883 RepID=UPI001153BB7F|nr:MULTISPECIES: hypothetical protein [Streptomyces]TQJ47349.1 hypothetical protein FBY34_6775 [Streptomyces sp. SLBN-115]
MADIFIPGTELDEVRRSLGTVMDNIDTGNAGIDFERALGSPLVDAARNFENRWVDGRTQVRREAKGIRDAAEDINDQFTQTDNDAAANLGAPR